LDIVVVGHLSRDLLITPTLRREALGGGTAYAMLAPALGNDSGIVTKVGADFEADYEIILRESGLNLNGFTKSGQFTTRFINEYDQYGTRTQRIEHLAPPILANNLSSHLETRCIHFCPLTRIELEKKCFELASKSDVLVSLDIQGFTRGVKGDLVISRGWNDASEVLQYVDIVKADTSELLTITGVSSVNDARDFLFELGVNILVLTRDRQGSTIFSKSELIEIPIVLANHIIDATGSGDTYIIGFLCEYLESKDLFRSGLFGATCASYNLENIGPYNLPNRDDIEKRLKPHL